MSKLIIVESPSKIKTVKKTLGSDYTVMASKGHIRDLPKSKLGVDVANGFKPQYISMPDKKELIKELQEYVKKNTAPYKYPRIVEFVDELPKTFNGKIKRNAIRENDMNKANQ